MSGNISRRNWMARLLTILGGGWFCARSVPTTAAPVAPVPVAPVPVAPTVEYIPATVTTSIYDAEGRLTQRWEADASNRIYSYTYYGRNTVSITYEWHGGTIGPDGPG